MRKLNLFFYSIGMAMLLVSILIGLTTPALASQPTPTPNDIEPAPTTVYNPAGLNLGAGSGFISLDNPMMVSADQANWLKPDEIVMGVEQNGEAHAFPISQMAYHHIANTVIGGEPYLVTY